MATLSITKQWANGEILLEADLDFIKSDLETFLNTTKINDDNIQTGGITGSTKLVDLSVSAGKLATDSVTTAKIVDSNVTTVKIADANVTYAKLATAVTTTLTPPGVVWPYAGTSAPTGFLLCDGSAISRSTYSALFAVIAEIYGAGDSVTTFNIPDLRGRVVAGQDDMGGSSANRLTDQTGGLNGDTLGATGGSETHTLTVAQMPSHDHGGATGSTSFFLRDQVTETGAVSVMSATSDGSGASGAHTHTISSQGSGTAHNNVQPTIILNYIIKT